MIINQGLQSRTVKLVTSNKKMLDSMRPWRRGGGGGSTPLYGLYRYVQPQRVWFLINRVSIYLILAILIINRVWFLHSSLDLGMF